MKLRGSTLIRFFSFLVMVTTLIFVVLKLTDNFDHSWWVVFAPFLVYLAIALISVVASVLTLSALVSIMKEREKEEEDYFHGH